MSKPLTYAEAITEQQIFIQRKNDRLHGRHRMDFDQFCTAIDEIIPKDMVNGIGLKSRDVNKAMAEFIHNETGKSYYDIFISIKYNVPI